MARFKNIFALLLLAGSVVLAGCTTTPRVTTSDVAADSGVASESSDTQCEANCEGEDGVGRYQYYLGILSVLIMG